MKAHGSARDSAKEHHNSNLINRCVIFTGHKRIIPNQFPVHAWLVHGNMNYSVLQSDLSKHGLMFTCR